MENIKLKFLEFTRIPRAVGESVAVFLIIAIQLARGKDPFEA